MRKVRCDRLYWCVRLFNDSGYCLSQGFVKRKTISSTACQLYSRSSPVMAKKWNKSVTTQHAHGFAKPQSLKGSFLRREDVVSGSRSRDGKFKREEEDVDSDPETEDEDELGRKSRRKLKSQKSGKGTLRPSRYTFREDGVKGEEDNLWERRRSEVNVKGKLNWYARQMLRLTQEDKVQ